MSFLTVIMALLGGANSVWGPILGVVPLVLIQDYLSIAWASHFSVLLGLVLLGIVFFIPNGLVGLLRSGWGRMSAQSLLGLLHGLAERIGGRVPRGDARHPALPAGNEGFRHGAGRLEAKDRQQRTTEP
jgi:hypothetical protein